LAEHEDTAGHLDIARHTLGLETAGAVRFHYVKSPQFRSIFVSGAHGGPTPDGRHICLVVFNERLPIPQQTVQDVLSDGRIGDERVGERVAKRDIVREVEVSAYMDMTTAAALHQWLGEWLKRAEVGTEGAPPTGESEAQ